MAFNPRSMRSRFEDILRWPYRSDKGYVDPSRVLIPATNTGDALHWPQLPGFHECQVSDQPEYKLVHSASLSVKVNIMIA